MSAVENIDPVECPDCQAAGLGWTSGRDGWHLANPDGSIHTCPGTGSHEELRRRYRGKLRLWAFEILTSAGGADGVEVSDLISAGLLGVIEAYEDRSSAEAITERKLRAHVRGRSRIKDELDRLTTGAVADVRLPSGKRAHHTYSEAHDPRDFDDPKHEPDPSLRKLQREIRGLDQRRGSWGPNANFVDPLLSRLSFEAALETIPNWAAKDRALVELLRLVNEAPRNDPGVVPFWERHRTAKEVVIEMAGACGLSRNETLARLKRAELWIGPYVRGGRVRQRYRKLPGWDPRP